MARASKTKTAAVTKIEVATPAPAVAVDQSFSDVLVGPLQLRVLHVLWGRTDRSGTVQDVHQALNSQGRPALAYTTVLTVMRNLARREVVAQLSGGRQHIFRVFDDQPTYERKLAHAIVADLFGGDRKRLLSMVGA